MLEGIRLVDQAIPRLSGHVDAAALENSLDNEKPAGSLGPLALYSFAAAGRETCVCSGKRRQKLVSLLALQVCLQVERTVTNREAGRYESPVRLNTRDWPSNFRLPASYIKTYS
jgi:hypothetical protein